MGSLGNNIRGGARSQGLRRRPRACHDRPDRSEHCPWAEPAAFAVYDSSDVVVRFPVDCVEICPRLFKKEGAFGTNCGHQRIEVPLSLNLLLIHDVYHVH
jgi:hypothetical protein